jgi:hypothetical protein
VNADDGSQARGIVATEHHLFVTSHRELIVTVEDSLRTVEHVDDHADAPAFQRVATHGERVDPVSTNRSGCPIAGLILERQDRTVK